MSTAVDTLSTDFRTFFGNVPTAVTAIVSRNEDGPIGLIVGSFASVSLDPPIVSMMMIGL